MVGVGWAVLDELLVEVLVWLRGGRLVVREGRAVVDDVLEEPWAKTMATRANRTMQKSWSFMLGNVVNQLMESVRSAEYL